MKAEWEHLLRAVVHGEYFLKKFIAEDNGAGLFLASDSAGRHRLVRIVPADDPAAEAFDRHWSPLAALSHPGLVQTIAYGTVSIDGEPFLCSVTERPEDVLADVLPTRCLTPAEARVVLESTLPALQYLHEHNYVHGAYGPENIVAVGEDTKLTTDSIRPIAASGTNDRKLVAQEIRRVGQCLTAMLCPPGTSKTAAALAPEFAIIMRTSAMADERWSPTADDLLQALNGVDIKPREEPQTPPVAAPEKPPQAPEPPRPAPVAASVPQPPPKRRAYIVEEPVVVPRQSHRVAISIGAVLIVLASLVMLRLSNRNTAASAQPTEEAPEVRRSRTSERVPINAPVAAPARVETPQTPQRPRAEPGRAWAVVAAIYRNQEAAQRRATQLGRSWQASTPAVLPPESGARRYLVVIASGLSRQEADRLRERAIASGMPRDSYVTRLLR